MNKAKKKVRVQRQRKDALCPQLRGAFLAVKRVPRVWWSISFFTGGAVFVIGVFLLTQWMFARRDDGVVLEVPLRVEQPAIRHALTGAPLAEADGAHRIFAVMVENSADAWPLSGVEEAFLAIEAPAEADIPRFVAFYADDQPAVDTIGPVRSARRYYLDWVAEFSALYAHVGGSPAALAAIPSLTSITNFDEFFNGSFFWRAKDRYAPHNAYTSTDLLVRGAEAKELAAVQVAPWRFVVPAEIGASGVRMDVDWMEGTTYDLSWRMREDGQYVRYRGERPVLAADGDEYVVANVIALETDIRVVDAVGRKEVVTIGEGAAVALVAGEKIDARWRKESAEERLRFYRADNGEEIVFAPGKTWIGVLPTDLTAVQIQSADGR